MDAEEPSEAAATLTCVTPARALEHRNALVDFHNAYVQYLDSSNTDTPGERARLRSEAARLIPEAQMALDAAPLTLTVTPPPAFGGPILTGLPNLAFVHEQQPLYRAVPTYVVDSVRLAAGYLETEARELSERRRNPLYWIDRALRAILGIPAYLLSLILGVPAARIDASPWGTALRVLELVLGAFGVYFGGQAAGWW